MIRISGLCLFLVSILWTTGRLQAEESARAAFSQLLDEAWEFELREDPLLATQSGDHRYNDLLPHMSLADVARRQQVRQGFLDRLAEIDRDQLSPSEQVDYAIFARKLTDAKQEFRFQSHLTPVSNRSGLHTRFPDLPKRVPLKTTDDYENYIARLGGFTAYVAGHIELMRSGLRNDVTQPAVIFDSFRGPLEAQVVDDPTASVLYEPLKALPSTVPEADHDRLRAGAREAIATSVVPGFRRLLQFMEQEYVPHCRGSIGASGLPEGREFYRYRTRHFTTLDISPEEVHQIGLREVARIRGEMEEIIRAVGFAGDFAAFTEKLRTDPQFYAQTEEEFLQHVALILKRMDGRLPELFGLLPRTPYGLKPIPDYIAPQATAAYYMPPTGDGTKAGIYYLNTYDLPSRPLYTAEALALHEAVPGHHLQSTLQQEIENLHGYRKQHWITAFGEGWALYAERLGLEVGFYEDPYSDFGRLTMEIWRACRLVVDTGLHYFGWTRAQAIEYLHENSAMSLLNIRSEVDRYIGWPGQALAYKMGELKIRDLRAEAEGQLAERFDVRSFHDVVLGSGCVPLDVLQENVQAWIERQQMLTE